MPDETFTIDNDGLFSRLPEVLEPPVSESPELLKEMIRLETSVGNPATAELAHRLKLIDADFAPQLRPVIAAELTGGGELAQYPGRITDAIAASDRAVADARTAWMDPIERGKKVEKLQRDAVIQLEGLYRDCRASSAAFARRYAVSSPEPDDVSTLEVGELIARTATPAAAVAWFTDAAVSGGRPWSLLRLVAQRLGDAPPAHIRGTVFQRAFRELAERPFADPHDTARAAREFAADIVSECRRKITNWSLAAAGARM